MNRPITSMGIGTSIKNFPKKQTNKQQQQQKKSPRLDGFTDDFYQKFRAELTPILLKLFQKHCRGRTALKLILQGDHHPDTKNRQKCHTKKKTTCQYH